MRLVVHTSSSKRSLLLRADASPQIGLGHVMRCLSLAEPWVRGGSTVKLLSSAPSSAVAARASGLGIEVCELAALPGSEADREETCALANSVNATWVVLDGYHFGADFQRTLKLRRLRQLVFDDTADLAYFAADFVLNQNLGASPAMYSRRDPGTRLLLGPSYVQLRGEFTRRADLRDAGSAFPPEAPLRLLLTLGGSDPENHTWQILTALGGVSNLEFDVIIGPANPHVGAWQALRATADPRITVHINPPDLPGLMARSNLAICAGGTTAWELCFLGVPLLVLALEENQRSNAELLMNTGAARGLGWVRELTTSRLVEEVRQLMADAAARADMGKCGRALVDGLGSERVKTILQNA